MNKTLVFVVLNTLFIGWFIFSMIFTNNGSVAPMLYLNIFGLVLNIISLIYNIKCLFNHR